MSNLQRDNCCNLACWGRHWDRERDWYKARGDGRLDMGSRGSGAPVPSAGADGVFNPLNCDSAPSHSTAARIFHASWLAILSMILLMRQ